LKHGRRIRAFARCDGASITSTRFSPERRLPACRRGGCQPPQGRLATRCTRVRYSFFVTVHNATVTLYRV
jgi:hypothetical protein